MIIINIYFRDARPAIVILKDLTIVLAILLPASVNVDLVSPVNIATRVFLTNTDSVGKVANLVTATVLVLRTCSVTPADSVQ